MDTCEDTAKKVNATYKNIIDELGPCIKQLVVAGRMYLKSIHGMGAAYRNYNEALSRVAHLADNSTLKGSGDIGSAIHHVVDINKEMLAQQSNVLKSLEFDFLEPMEIAADKDTKLIGREQKRFQQLQKNRRDDFDKSVSTLKKSRRKKSINTDKQLSNMKVLENSKTRLQEFCDESLKEAIVQERIMYGTVLEKLSLYSKQALIYHNKGCELLEVNIPKWEGLADTKDILPNSCFPLHATPEKSDVYSIYAPAAIDSTYTMGSPVDAMISRSPSSRSNRRNDKDNESLMSAAPRLETLDRSGVYARPMVRAKSEYNLSTNSYLTNTKPATPPSRFSRIIEYNGDATLSNYLRALYPYEAKGDYQMALNEGDIVKFEGKENATGWQFGDNLMSKRSGWFPLSYTEPIQIDQQSLHTTSNGSAKANRRPLPPPPPTVAGSQIKSLSQQVQSSETSDYGTLRRLKLTPRKLLPVDPPKVSMSNIEQEETVYQNSSILHSMHSEETYSNASDYLMTERSIEKSGYHSSVPRAIEKSGYYPDSPRTIEKLGYHPNFPLQSMHL